MPVNPLEDSPARDAAIGEKAEELWKADGSPACGPEAYHEQASDLVGMEEHPHAGEVPVRDLPPRSLRTHRLKMHAYRRIWGNSPNI